MGKFISFIQIPYKSEYSKENNMPSPLGSALLFDKPIRRSSGVSITSTEIGTLPTYIVEYTDLSSTSVIMESSLAINHTEISTGTSSIKSIMIVFCMSFI
jgi:hypothetical protein